MVKNSVSVNFNIETCYNEEVSTNEFCSDSIKSDHAFAFFDERRNLNLE